VEADDADVFLSCLLLRLDQTSGAIDADNEATGDLWVEGTTVPRLLNPATTLAMSMRKQRDAYLRILFTQDTTSWLEGLAGLSRLMTPCLT
jgi:hypothetical protein